MIKSKVPENDASFDEALFVNGSVDKLVVVVIEVNCVVVEVNCVVVVSTSIQGNFS
jgi:hypothetical protein